MIMILVAIVVAAIISALMLWYASEKHGILGMLFDGFGFVIAVGAGMSAVAYVFALLNWLAADQKAQVINRECGTAYTQAEVFWAGDVITTMMCQPDRKQEAKH